MQVFLRKYNTSGTIDFDLYSPDGSNILTSAAISPSACTISFDSGTSAFPVNLPTITQNGFSINFTSSELSVKRLHFKIVDDNVTKTWLDRSFVIETYGSSASQHGDLASGLLDNIIDTVPLRDLLIEAISQLTGDIIRSGDAFEYFKKDGTTSHTLSAAYGARAKL